MHLNYSSCPMQTKTSKHALLKTQFNKVIFLSGEQNHDKILFFSKSLRMSNCSSRLWQLKRNHSFLITLFWKSLRTCIISEHLRSLLLTSLGLFLCLKRNKCLMFYWHKIKALLILTGKFLKEKLVQIQKVSERNGYL